MDEERNIKKTLEYQNIDNTEKSVEPDLLEDTRAKTGFDSEKLIEQRKEKLMKFFKSKQAWVLVFLIIAIILGVYIRSMPMIKHGENPGLWDITKNTWTLGPDLDPWLFERHAKTIVEQGGLPEKDMMRNVPLGFLSAKETKLLPYMIVGTYYLINIFGNYSVTYAAVVFPVFMIVLTILSFFLFTREVFIRKSKQSVTKANIIALIATFFMIVIPVFLSRTIAGIPEKESAAFFFMFLAFYLFLKSWKSEKIKNIIILSVLAGISTSLMGLIWGGFIYVFITIGLATLIAFMLNKVDKKEFIAYTIWIFSSFPLMIICSYKFSLRSMLTSLSSGFAFLVFLILLIHFILWKTKISKIDFLNKIKLPKNIISLIVAFVLLILLSVVFFGPGFIIGKVKAIHQTIFKPIFGRWNITVAENRQPYFAEWGSSFGPFIKNVPVLFWLFFAGSVVLFKKMFNKIKKKDSWILTGLYVLFFFGIVFSRYSGSSLFNGENFISKLFYYSSSLLLIGFSIFYYMKYHKENNPAFEKIKYELIFLFSLFILVLFTVRGAIRLVMVLGPISAIFVGFLIVESIERFRKSREETAKIFLGVLVILILVLSIFTFLTFYRTVKAQAYNFVPSSYNQQWQKAMKWVRDETPQNSVFGHWWDYGYWLQSIGERATVLDGGNSITYWNYLMGRLVLTGDNQKEALEFLYNHNTTHFLIDSTDIGKYGAFSSIGSNKDFDKYSWIGTFVLDERQTQETNNQTIHVYQGGIGLDEDLLIEDGKTLLPAQKTGVGAIILPETKDGDIGQPYAILVYQGRQHTVYLRYLYVNGELRDFNSGIEATAYVFPSLIQQGQGVNQNPAGAVMFLSPRLMRGMLAQVYILNDPFNKFPNFRLTHTESSLIIDGLRSQGMNLPEFVYFQGVQGPIKIWEVKYTGSEEIKQEYLDVDHRKYLDWEL